MPVLTPSTVDEVLSHLAERPDALLLSGGTDVMVEINMARRKAPPEVVALRGVEELRLWQHEPSSNGVGGTVTIGAGVPYAEMEHGPLAEIFPALAEAARTVGSPQIRAAGTLGGNLGTCSPAGDGLPVLYALDAVIHLRSLTGGRDVPVAEFMVGVKQNVLAPGELITGVTIPVRRGWQGYSKVGVRNAMVIATASACLAMDRDRGVVSLALGAVGTTIIRCRDAETWLADQVDLSVERPEVGAELAREFGQRAAADARPIDDHRSTAAYRGYAVGVLSSRLLKRAAR
ncbi:MAG: FAD binding domain-containing protein [Geodermatophilaceae bacterium]|nr:FAD binding domain-containing protein [Geodermatophilaceae bacterium]